jgi:chemotaxis protein CheD
LETRVDSPRDVQVRMGRLAIGSGQDVLRAILGSCVGIGLLWRERALYGLAHCLLPEPLHGEGTRDEGGAKYVTQAIPALLAMMEAQHAPRGRIEAVLAGGANMVHLSPQPRHGPIGEQNVRVAQRLLETCGMRVVHVDVGGECGRQLSIDCAQHQYTVKRIARPE